MMGDGFSATNSLAILAEKLFDAEAQLHLMLDELVSCCNALLAVNIAPEASTEVAPTAGITTLSAEQLPVDVTTIRAVVAQVVQQTNLDATVVYRTCTSGASSAGLGPGRGRAAENAPGGGVPVRLLSAEEGATLVACAAYSPYLSASPSSSVSDLDLVLAHP